MDIHKWLQATTDRAPPDKSDNVDVPRFLEPAQAESKPAGRNYHRKRKQRESSDSSIIAQDRNDHNAEARKRTKRRHDDDSDDSDLYQQHSSETHSKGTTSYEVPSKTYERRRRHKTKPDRYEPKTKKPKKERKTRARKETARKKHRSHRHDGERTTGLIQSFQLKNGPKNHRLTLKPDANAGLFKHGRASVQMTSRGNGLPDLVFNEMKFLQRPTEHQDSVTLDEPLQKDSKNKQQRASNEEISAYFTTNNTVHNDSNGVAKMQKESAEDECQRRGHEQQRKPPSIELPEKPFLGFGSKGVHNKSSRHRQDQSTEYYSWSESASEEGRISNAPEKPAQRQGIRDGPLEQTKDTKHSPRRRNAHNQKQNFGDDQEPQKRQWIQSRRARGSRVVETYQPSATRNQQRGDDRTSVTRTTKQSLPQNPTYREQEPGNGSQHTGDFGRLRSDYRTSDILNLPNSQHDLTIRGSANYLSKLQADTLSSNKENSDPQSSLDRLLNEARKATEYTGRPLENSMNAMHEYTPQHRVEPRGHASSHRMPFNQLDSRKEVKVTQGQPRYKERTPGARYRQPPNLDPRFNTTGFDPVSTINWYGRDGPFEEQLEDHEMLDIGPDIHQSHWPVATVHTSGWQPEDLVSRADFIPRSGVLGAQNERLESELHERSLLRDSISRHTLPSHVSSIGREIVSERFDPPQSEADDVFAGFWKPNKLY